MSLHHPLHDPTQEELRTYLDPAQWDGHMLGYCPPEVTDEPAPLDRRAVQAARHLLQQQLRQDVALPNLIPHMEGTFHASEYQPGTLLLFASQLLRRVNLVELKEHEQAMEPIPEPAPRLDLNLGKDEGKASIIFGNNVVLARSVEWGIVSPRGERGEHTFVGFSTGSVYKAGRSRVNVTLHRHKDKYGQDSITVGETQHTIGADKMERLYKVPLLYLCGVDKPKR